MKTAAAIGTSIVLLAMFAGISYGAYLGFHGWVKWPVGWSIVATVGSLAVFPAGMGMATLGAINVWRWPAVAAVATFVGAPMACAVLIFVLLVYVGPWWDRRTTALMMARLSERE